MGRMLKQVGFTLCRALGSMAASGGMPVLAFHSIDDSGSYASTAILHFRVAMERLAEHGIRGITVAEASERIRAGHVPEKLVVLTFDDGLSSFGEHAWPIMLEYGHRGTLYVTVDNVGGVAAWYKDYGLPLMRTHTWDELRKLQDEGADIQSHGCRHPKLTTLDAASMHEELARSREMLEKELGACVEHFCYPFGDYNDDVVREVHACGYVSAVTMDPGCWRPDSDPFAVSRDCLNMINLHDGAFSKRVIDACLDGSYSRYVAMRDRLRALAGMSWEPPRGS